MRAYLKNFFVKFDYPDEDVKILLNTYDLINGNAEAKKLWDAAITMYDEDIHCDFQQIIEIADEVASQTYLKEYTVNLLLLICLSKRAEDVYKEHGIEEEIFYNNMCDLKYKLIECKLVKGIHGTFVAPWFDGFFNLTRFGLGRLQFEIVDFKKNYSKNGKLLTPESKVINIHIPRTETPLDPKSCDESFDMAKAFFKDKIGDECAFVCHSWLLYPENKNILPKHTNIYKFMERFDIIDSGISKDDEDLWRLFDTEEKNYDKLPVDTSVRRAFVKHLQNGGKTGWGYGVFFW